MKIKNNFIEIPKKYKKTIQLFLTQKCNFDCDFCFRKGKDMGIKDMNINDAKKILLKYKGADVKVSFSGGEPALNPNLDSILRYCAELKINSEIYTNGKQHFNNYDTIARLGYDGFDNGNKPMSTKKYHGAYELGVMFNGNNTSQLIKCILATKDDPFFSGIIEIVDLIGKDNLPMGGIEVYKKEAEFIANYIADNCPWINRIEISVGKLGINTNAPKCRFKMYLGNNKLIETCICGLDPLKCSSCLLQSQVFVRKTADIPVNSQDNLNEKINHINSLIEDEHQDQEFLHLTANENQMSKTARKFLCSKLSERYYFGKESEKEIVDFGVFAAKSLRGLENLICSAEESLKKMLKAPVVNLKCLSGIHAMMSAILSTTNPGDSVMIVHTDHGGHFCTKEILDLTGRKPVFASYNTKELKFDIKEMANIFKKNKCKALYLDVSFYISPHNLKEIRKALGEKAIIIYDASHTIGLILGGKFQSPFEEGADLICANTHKTLPGPQKGLIAFKNKNFGEKCNNKIGVLQSSTHTHHMGALAITILEMEKYGKEYASQIIKNTNKLGEELSKLGYKIRKTEIDTFSENHQLHLFIDNLGDRRNLYKRLFDNNISSNFENILGGKLFIRLGTQEITRRGMKEKDMKTIANFINMALKGEKIKNQILDFNKKFSDIEYSFDKD